MSQPSRIPRYKSTSNLRTSIAPSNAHSDPPPNQSATTEPPRRLAIPRVKSISSISSLAQAGRTTKSTASAVLGYAKPGLSRRPSVALRPSRSTNTRQNPLPSLTHKVEDVPVRKALPSRPALPLPSRSQPPQLRAPRSRPSIMPTRISEGRSDAPSRPPSRKRCIEADVDEPNKRSSRPVLQPESGDPGSSARGPTVLELPPKATVRERVRTLESLATRAGMPPMVTRHENEQVHPGLTPASDVFDPYTPCPKRPAVTAHRKVVAATPLLPQIAKGVWTPADKDMIIDEDISLVEDSMRMT